MDFNLDYNLVRSQKLLLIPQLKLAIDVLEMDSRELFGYIENQLETNPALEADMDAGAAPYGCEEENDARMQDDSEDSLTLKQHLLIQFNTMRPDKTSLMIGEYLIDNTDDSGYLKVDISEVAEFFNIPSSKVASVLETLQSLDPPGICARNLRECLLLQLKQLDDTDENTVRIVQKYLDSIAADDAGTVAAETGIPEDRVREIFEKVKALEPRPGREYYNSAEVRPAPPDVIVREDSGVLRVSYNEEAFPDVCISESFEANVSRLAETEGDDYIHEIVKNAVWLIKCLEQRKNIILDIASALLECEKGFFKYGRKSIKMLDKSSFAASLNMHESILEKALKGKTLQCRWGTFEFGSFFNTEAISLKP